MKRKNRLAAGLLFLLLIFTLSACGSSDGYTGTWCCAYMENGSLTMTAGDMDNVGTELYIVLRQNGKGIMTADGETQDITWAESDDGSALLLTVDGEQEEFKLQDDALVWTLDSTTLTFLREDSDAYQEALETVSTVTTVTGTD